MSSNLALAGVLLLLPGCLDLRALQTCTNVVCPFGSTCLGGQCAVLVDNSDLAVAVSGDMATALDLAGDMRVPATAQAGCAHGSFGWPTSDPGTFACLQSAAGKPMAEACNVAANYMPCLTLKIPSDECAAMPWGNPCSPRCGRSCPRRGRWRARTAACLPISPPRLPVWRGCGWPMRPMT